MVEAQAIDVRPEFQRRERWTQEQQSALIESFLLNIPVPPIYLSEDAFGFYSVIDGKQRVTAVHAFMKNQLRLSGLTRFAEVNGLTFKQLPPPLQNALLVRPYLRTITVLRQSDRQTKYEVFHRLNSGGEPLNAQEIRNVIFRGPLNDVLVKLSDSKFLRDQLKIRDERSPAYQKMSDIEFVLRFFTLEDTWQTFSGDFRLSMDSFMENHATTSPSRITELIASFQSALLGCEEIWGSDAFKRPDKTTWRDQMLAGMYDAQMIAVSMLDKEEVRQLTRRKVQVRSATRALFDNLEFDAAVRVATNTPSRVKYRIETMHDALKKTIR